MLNLQECLPLHHGRCLQRGLEPEGMRGKTGKLGLCFFVCFSVAEGEHALDKNAETVRCIFIYIHIFRYSLCSVNLAHIW